MTSKRSAVHWNWTPGYACSTLYDQISTSSLYNCLLSISLDRIQYHAMITKLSQVHPGGSRWAQKVSGDCIRPLMTQYCVRVWLCRNITKFDTRFIMRLEPFVYIPGKAQEGQKVIWLWKCGTIFLAKSVWSLRQNTLLSIPAMRFKGSRDESLLFVFVINVISDDLLPLPPLGLEFSLASIALSVDHHHFTRRQIFCWL